MMRPIQYTFSKLLNVFPIASVVVLASCGGGSSNTPQNDPVDICSNPSGLPDASFSLSRPFINVGEASILTWESADAERITIEPGLGAVQASGELSVSPASSTQYTLSATSGENCNQLVQVLTVREEAAISIQANTLQGLAPLSVRFTPLVDSRTAINRYYWDFEGDGGVVDGGLGTENAQGFDRVSLSGIGTRDFDVVGRDLVHEFTTPGTYTVRARVWDIEDNQADAELTITVNNAPPQAVVSASPTTGTVPLSTTLEVTSASDNEGISLIEWDFEGDGVYDESIVIDPPQTTIRARNARVTRLYETVGTFKPSVRVTDILGATSKFDPLNLQVNAILEEVPAVTLSASPNEGEAPLNVFFSARVFGASRNPAYAWDFDGDGTVDNTTDTRPTFVYDRIGTFYPTLSITSDDGSVGRDIISITVEANHTLAIEDATINPEADETTDITLTVNGASPLQFVIENASGEVTKTFIDWQETATGEYNFNWDGHDDSGSVPPPGDYYAVIRYRVDGREETLDLRTTTGGLIFYPNDNSVSNTCERGVDCGVLTISGIDTSNRQQSFAPYGDTPINFAFDLPQNGKVSAYVTVRGSENFSPATFFRSRNLPQGNYSINWFADGTDGQILPSRPSSRGYVPAIFGLSASDNAIFLSHQTKLENLVVSPSIFFPSIASNGLTNAMSFDLSRDADILMRIDSVEAGTEIYRKIFTDVAAGQNITLGWDGKINDSDFVAPGGYRITLTAQDEFGQSSLSVSALQRIQY